MVNRPCLDCGQIAARSRCEECRLARNRRRDSRRGGARQRGYTTEHDRNRATVLEQSRVCWLCGHDGADQVDDVVPKAKGGTSALANLRPAHGTNPCPTCGVRCNQSRGSRTVTSDRA